MKRPSNEPVEKAPPRRASRRVRGAQPVYMDSDMDEEGSYVNSPASKETSEPMEEKSIIPPKKSRKSRSVRDDSQDSAASIKNIPRNKPSVVEQVTKKRSTRGRKPKREVIEKETNNKEKSTSTTSSNDDVVNISKGVSKEITVKNEENVSKTEVDDTEHVEEDESTESESSDEEPIDFSKIETVAKGRPRRANAGNKMALLLTKEEKELMAEASPEYQDYFNNKIDNNIVDGENDIFSEKDVDDSGDEIDSDFLDSDKSDDEGDGEKAEKEVIASEREERRRLKRKYKSNTLDIPVSAYTVKPNVLSPKEHEEALKKSLKIAEENIASLQKYQAMEIETKNKRFNKSKKTKGSQDIDIIIKKGKDTLLHLAVEPIHDIPKKAKRLICAISGKPAKYMDPLTEMPYYSLEEFKIIRKMYEEYVNTVEGDFKSLKVSSTIDTS
uniref:Vacuolar protein sorting-associated protein 72 homolog n=1 Tax=Parastrongyloides trichosuri TaxID=131310 RepID=A0A0N5A1D0_PARTI